MRKYFFLMFWIPILLLSQSVSIEFRHESVRSILEKVSEQASVGFVFQDALIRDCRSSCEGSFETIDSALQNILGPHLIKFRQLGKDLFVLYKTEDEKREISGWIVDASNGRALPGANIWLQDTDIGTASDTDGTFILNNLPAELCTINVSYIGYKDEQIVPSDQQSVQVQMNPTPVPLDKVEVTAERDKISRSCPARPRSHDLGQYPGLPSWSFIRIQQSVQSIWHRQCSFWTRKII